MTIHQNLIAGEWVGSDAIRNINPSNTDDVVGEYARASVEDTKAAISAAKAAIASASVTSSGAACILARPAIAASSLALLRPVTITTLPASCQRCASARPMPDPPPVTRMVLPVVFIDCPSFRGWGGGQFMPILSDRK